MDLGNVHFEQGIEFKRLANDKKDNDYIFLQETSSPEVGSIIEALSRHDSANPSTEITLTKLSQDEATFNNLISAYTTLHRTYTSTMLNKAPTATDRIAMETDLANKKAQIIAAANAIKSSMLSVKVANETDLTYLAASLPFEHSISMGGLAEYNSAIMRKKNRYDDNTINGKIETTELNMTSMHYHLIVYFFIVITLIAFTFNLMTNPNASELNAIFVVGALFIVFYISQKFVNI